MQTSFNANDQVSWQTSFLASLDVKPKEGEVFYEISHFSFPWQSIDVDQFQESLKTRFLITTEQIAQEIFRREVEELQNHTTICIAYTGSDGRAEKLSTFSSPMELMFIVKMEKDLNENKQTLEKVKSLAKKYPELFFRKIEKKSIDKDSLICFRHKVKKNIKDAQGDNVEVKEEDIHSFPTRALDAHYLAGNFSILEEYKQRFYAEVQQKTSNKFLRSFRMGAVKASIQLTQASIEVKNQNEVDIARGVVIYNGDRLKATKYPFLRPLQYKLADYICKLIKSNKLRKEDFLEMPFSVIDRINWLIEKKFLKVSKERAVNVQRAYIVSLIWLGMAQKNFELNNQSEMQLSQASLKEVGETISHFCSDKTIFPEEIKDSCTPDS